LRAGAYKGLAHGFTGPTAYRLAIKYRSRFSHGSQAAGGLSLVTARTYLPASVDCRLANAFRPHIHFGLHSRAVCDPTQPPARTFSMASLEPRLAQPTWPQGTSGSQGDIGLNSIMARTPIVVSAARTPSSASVVQRLAVSPRPHNYIGSHSPAPSPLRPATHPTGTRGRFKRRPWGPVVAGPQG
jgi:hypothetical protein